MARTRYGKLFRTRKGKLGRYKYVNGKRVGFVKHRRFRTRPIYHKFKSWRRRY